MNAYPYPFPANESARLNHLEDLGIVGSAPEAQFDALVALACRVFQTPIALISLVGRAEQTFKAVCGLDIVSTERETSFCNYAVATGELFVVEDATAHAVLRNNRLVTELPHIRFYAGAPISVEPGLVLGTLCIIDNKPRTLSGSDSETLREMAQIASALIQKFRDARIAKELALAHQEQSSLLQIQTRSLERHKRMFDRSATLIKIGAWEWDIPTGHLTWSDGMFDIHELPRGSHFNETPGQGFYTPESASELHRLYETSDRNCSGFAFEGKIVTAKGSQRWVRLTVDVECEDGRVVRRFGMKQDITEQRLMVDKLRYLAECDPLTNLSNRSALQTLLGEAMERDLEEALRDVLLLVDLDGFKHVNDTYGHEAGDACLRQIGDRLRVICQEATMISRLGGDEFALFLKGQHHDAAIMKRADRILECIRLPITWCGVTFHLSASIGIAASQVDGKRLDLLTHADLALYAAKAAGRNTVRMFVPEMKKAAEARFETIRDISRALLEGQLRLFYQPKVRLADNSLAGFEALLRWLRPDGQIVTAGAFSAALEDPEVSRNVGAWVIDETLKQAQRWLRAGLDFGHIAVNLSASQFRDPGFAVGLIAGIASHGLTPQMIEAEITEGVFLGEENGSVRHALEVMREAGIRISLDDFGTGYASLTHLRNYPVDVIKIDRSFVQHFLTSAKDHAILQSTLFLARHLDLDVVAEGVEERNQCEFLRALGCRYVQGFLFSKALPADQASDWCRPLLANTA